MIYLFKNQFIELEINENIGNSLHKKEYMKYVESRYDGIFKFCDLVLDFLLCQ